MNVYFSKTTHQDYVTRFKRSVIATGDNVIDLTLDSIPEYNDVIITWGVGNAKRWQNKGYKNLLIFERGYLGDRIEWLSLGWDNLNGKGNFYNQYVPEDRWNKYWKSGMCEWNTSNEVVLIAGQVIRDQALSDCENYNEWLNDTISALQARNHTVVFRPHPLETAYDISGVQVSTYSNFIKDVKRAKCVVAWSSTSTVTAAYLGIPSVTFSEHSMTTEVSSHSLDVLDFTPDRNNWGRKLAYCQWKPDELENGEAWYHAKTRFFYPVTPAKVY